MHASIRIELMCVVVRDWEWVEFKAVSGQKSKHMAKGNLVTCPA